MANQQARNEEESQLRRRARRRLIGAVTLVTIMVVALPMLLDGESRQSGQDIVISIPPSGSGGDVALAAPVLAKATPVPAAQHSVEKIEQTPIAAETQSVQDANVAPAAMAEEVVKAAVVATPVKAGVAVKESTSASKNKEEKPAAATHKQDGVPFEIQLGAFANMSNAKERQSKLAALKVKFYTETVKTPNGDKLRVRSGPYPTRQEAERVQAKLKAGGIMDGVVAEKK